MTLKNVTDSSFESEVMKSSVPVLVDFWAPWCGPCKQIAPALDEISAEMDGAVQVAKVNVDENPNVASQLGVRGIPALFMIKDGQVMSNMQGAATKASLLKFIKEAM